jgi:hypothetical protein
MERQQPHAGAVRLLPEAQDEQDRRSEDDGVPREKEARPNHVQPAR